MPVQPINQHVNASVNVNHFVDSTQPRCQCNSNHQPIHRLITQKNMSLHQLTSNNMLVNHSSEHAHPSVNVNHLIDSMECQNSEVNASNFASLHKFVKSSN